VVGVAGQHHVFGTQEASSSTAPGSGAPVRSQGFVMGDVMGQGLRNTFTMSPPSNCLESEHEYPHDRNRRFGARDHCDPRDLGFLRAGPEHRSAVDLSESSASP
jgi:hypothetical protein